MFKQLYVSCSSACFELSNKEPYYSPSQFKVYLNGKEEGEARSENVFSLFNLAPDTSYTLRTSLDGSEVVFRTLPETARVDVKALGAVGDGQSDETFYLQTAIDLCPAGGRVVVPEGTYLIRPVLLKSDITLELKKGAVLLGDPVEEHYPVVPARMYIDGKEVVTASWEGEPFDCYRSLLSAYGAKNVAVVGEGVINGNADNSTWWQTPKGRKIARPRLVFLNRCENVVFHGITGMNSASWNFHPFFSENLAFYGISVKCPPSAPNTDGLDPESCKNVTIAGCKFSVGDDCCAIKSGKIYMGKTYKTPADRHTLRNNLFCDGHGAIVLGSEMSGGVTNLTVSQCLFRHTDRGLRIKTRRGRGKDAVIDGVEFENIKMQDVITPFVINMYYFCDPDGKTEYVWAREGYSVDDGTPYLGKFSFRDIECNGCECMAGYFDGLTEQPIKEIALENVAFSFKADAKPALPAMLTGVREYCKEGLYADNVENLVLKNVTFKGVEGEKIIKKNIKNITELQ